MWFYTFPIECQHTIFTLVECTQIRCNKGKRGVKSILMLQK